MTPKQREAFDLLTLQLVEQGYIRVGGPADPEWDGVTRRKVTPEDSDNFYAVREADWEAGLSRPGAWVCTHAEEIVICNELRGGDAGHWEIRVLAPDYSGDPDPEGLTDYLGCQVCVWGADCRAVWADDGAVIVWGGLGQAVQWVEDLASCIYEKDLAAWIAELREVA